MLGLEAFLPRNQAVGPGHTTVDVGYGRLDGGAWYLVRWPDGHYDLHRIAAAFPRDPVAIRTIRLSPFAGEAAVYFGGYDANKAPAHDTAWIVRAMLDSALTTPN